MSLISAFSEGLIENVKELSEGFIIIVAFLELIPINSCEWQVLEKDNQDWDSKWVDVCSFQRIALLFDVGYLRWRVYRCPCSMIYPGIYGLTVSKVYERKSLMAGSLCDHHIVWFDITVRYLIFGVQIKKSIA